MTPSLNTINLIRTKTSSSPQLDAIEGSLRRTGYIALGAFLCVGFIIAVVYIFFMSEKSRLETTQKDLKRQLTANIQKEGMYLSIKDRTRIVKQVLANQKPWSKLLDQISVFTAPPVLTGISVDDQSKVTLTLGAGSIDSVLSVTNAVIAQAKEGKIINPQLMSFQISKTGNIVATISFLVIFSQL